MNAPYSDARPRASRPNSGGREWGLDKPPVMMGHAGEPLHHLALQITIAPAENLGEVLLGTRFVFDPDARMDGRFDHWPSQLHAASEARDPAVRSWVRSRQAVYSKAIAMQWDLE